MLKAKKYFDKAAKLILISIAALSLNGCATISGDNMRTVCVRSQPQGAGIYVDGQRQGTTPASITLPGYMYGGKSIVVKKEGYHDQAVIINTKFQPCGLWNLLFWPGFIIDGATGNTVKVDPAHANVFVELQPIESKE